MRILLAALVGTIASAWTGIARADATLAAPAGPGQQALGLDVTVAGIRARVCTVAPCSADGGVVLPSPDGPRPHFDRATATTIALEGGRTIARVDAPGDEDGSTFVALVAAPLAGKGAEPLVLFAGWTGAPRGDTGEEHGAAVLVERSPRGARVLVGERRADVTLCGRPTVVGARAVDPATLQLARGASVQNLGEEERAKATKLTAVRVKDPAPLPSVRVLRATTASSAYAQRLAALTDGDLATAWSENKVGDGRGELVTMSAPEEVGISALDLVIRPTTDVPEGAAPKRFYLATPDAVMEVAMPEDAWQKPAGTHYEVRLPAELHTSCLAVVLDEAYAGAHANPRVTVAEVTARTPLDGLSTEALAGALADGGPRSKAAAALLLRSGPPGIAAVIAAYDKLDDAAREMARGVVDAGRCSDQVPFFAARFAAVTAPGAPKAAPGEVDPELAHARDRLRRCGRASAPALVDLVARGSARTKILAADELAALAPAEAVPAILDAIASADDPTRRDLRAALARAAKSPRAAPALAAELAKDKLGARPEVAAIDLLRASGPVLAAVGGAPAFADLAARATSFSARFLLLGPAADLAAAGDRTATDFLARALHDDPDAHVRARAAVAAGAVPDLAVRLYAALDDADPRVREAAVAAIAEALRDRPAPASGPQAALRRRLVEDDWTFVRAGAAQALGAMPAETVTDVALAAALKDPSPDVRSVALDGLGAHRATAQIAAIRERQDDEDEVAEVRARAILALGVLCDGRSAGTWTKLAQMARAPIDDRGRRMAGAAIAALGSLHPKDLADRLAPLLDKNAPEGLREMAKAALGNTAACR